MKKAKYIIPIIIVLSVFFLLYSLYFKESSAESKVVIIEKKEKMLVETFNDYEIRKMAGDIDLYKGY